MLSVTIAGGEEPQEEALLADSVGLALLVVLETLSPAERLAFVLHDSFGVPFEEIAPIVERSVEATRQLASRARRRVRGAHDPSAEDLAQQRAVVEAFLEASRAGDFEALLEVLDPGVVFRADAGTSGPPVPAQLKGARDVAGIVDCGTPVARFGRPAMVNGRAGAVVVLPPHPLRRRVHDRKCPDHRDAHVVDVEAVPAAVSPRSSARLHMPARRHALLARRAGARRGTRAQDAHGHAVLGCEGDRA